MREPKHTPGPWLLDEEEFETTIYVPTERRDDQREVARVKILRYVDKRAAEALANAALIAAAPDLLAACRRVIEEHEQDNARPLGMTAAEELRAAIAKAAEVRRA